jgi:hypothetical protein
MNTLETIEIPAAAADNAAALTVEETKNATVICFRLGKHIDYRIGNLIRCARRGKIIYQEKREVVTSCQNEYKD